MNQQQKIQRLIDDRDEAQNTNKDLKNNLFGLANLTRCIVEACTKDVIEARRWALHYRRQYQMLEAQGKYYRDTFGRAEKEYAGQRRRPSPR